MKTVIQVLLGLGLLGALVFFLNPEQVAGVMSKITLTALTILFSLQLLTLAAGAWIWHFLLNRRSRVSYAWVLVINQAAGLVESLTPSVKFGGEAAKVYLFRKITGQEYHALTGILMVHKFITMLPFSLLCLFLLIPALFYFNLPLSYVSALIFVLAMSLSLGWLCYGKASPRSCRTEEVGKNGNSRVPEQASSPVRKWISKAALFLGQARTSAAGLLSAGQTTRVLLVSLVIWIFYPLKVYLVCYFLNIEVSPVIIGLATLFAYMISMAPLLPGGLGTYEGSMAMFFTLGGLSPAEGLAIALVSRLTTFWFPLVLSSLASLIIFRRFSFPGNDHGKNSFFS